jgi:predicted NAD/FAD-binding protein
MELPHRSIQYRRHHPIHTLLDEQPPGRLTPAKLFRRIEYHHPVFSLDAIAAQKELPSLNRISPTQSTYFCGSYFKYGFHEDAFTSALECSRAITGEPIWS